MNIIDPSGLRGRGSNPRGNPINPNSNYRLRIRGALNYTKTSFYEHQLWQYNRNISFPRKGSSRCKQVNRVIDRANKGWGNQGEDAVYTRWEAAYMALRFIGPNYRVSRKDSNVWVSSNGRRVVRWPSSAKRGKGGTSREFQMNLMIRNANKQTIGPDLKIVFLDAFVKYDQ